jgi:isopropylmalate/homocitrate/citramalate synthase
MPGGPASTASALLPVAICDVTLREGEQRVDGAISAGAKLAIARELSALGVAALQLGPGEEDLAVARQLRAAGLPCPVEITCFGMGRRWRELIDRVAAAGCPAVQIVIRAGREQLASMDWPPERVVDHAGVAVRHAASSGLAPCLGISFAPQADPAVLDGICAAAASAGARWVALADSLGTARPQDIAALVAQASRHRIPVSVHCHDDLGLAIANSLAGVEAGARRVEASVLGLGERSGNARLEVLAVALLLQFEADSGIRLDRLCRATATIAGLARVDIPPEAPVVGRHAFATKLDVHVRLAQRDSGALMPFDPALVGNKRQVVAGKGSGPVVLRAVLSRAGIELGDDQLPRLAVLVGQQAEREGRAMADDELARLAARLDGGGNPV